MATQDISYGITFRTDYPVVIYGDRSNCLFTNGRLAPATAGVVYAPGVILAQYTGGTYVGKYVNFDSVTGTNGQDTNPIGILTDDNFSLDNIVTIDNLQNEILIAGNVYADRIFGTQEADIAAYELAVGAKEYQSDGTWVLHITYGVGA
jgi:hypothetical protein